MGLRREPERRELRITPSKYEALEDKAREEDYVNEAAYVRQHEEHRAASDLAQAIGAYFNRGGDAVMLAQEISRREHRTLQQRIMGFVMAFIADEALLGGAGYYDLRNQAACGLAQQIMDTLGEDADLAQHLPFI